MPLKGQEAKNGREVQRISNHSLKHFFQPNSRTVLDNGGQQDKTQVTV
jgi:hypothetical protein